VLPSGRLSASNHRHWDGELQEAFAPMSVTICLEDEIDVSRGDMLVPLPGHPSPTTALKPRWSGWMRNLCTGTSHTFSSTPRRPFRHACAKSATA